MTSSLEEYFKEAIDSMEGDGIDFREEAAYFLLDYSLRPDLHITVTICHKDVADLFEEAEYEMRGRVH